mgnify:CR=1 FL=1
MIWSSFVLIRKNNWWILYKNTSQKWRTIIQNFSESFSEIYWILQRQNVVSKPFTILLVSYRYFPICFSQILEVYQNIVMFFITNLLHIFSTIFFQTFNLITFLIQSLENKKNIFFWKIFTKIYRYLKNPAFWGLNRSPLHFYFEDGTRREKAK